MKGLYVHIPFCIRKCKYCDFNSFSACESEKESYLNALFNEFSEYKGEKVNTVFIGGGTPTALNENQLERLLKKIRENFVISEDAEITMEANPKTITKEKLDTIIKYGVNRLSVGVQSFCDKELKALGRIHNSRDAIETIILTKKMGFTNISIDLMLSIPHQTKDSLKRTLETAFSQNPNHISCYSLILEEGTELYNEVKCGKVSQFSEDEESELYDFAVQMLEDNGYKRYEISNFARDNKISKHNKKYWDADEYIGVGLSAHSYINGVRFSNTDNFASYINGDFHNKEREVLSKNDKMSEFVFLGLRKREGISKAEFSKRFGCEINSVFGNPIKKFTAMGFLIDDCEHLYLSKDAVSVSNSIMCEFII